MNFDGNTLPFVLDKLKDWLYGLPDPPARIRTKPLQVICAGPSRSGTESLAIALRKLGIDTYHGWDIFLDGGAQCYRTAKLMRKKWRGPPDGESHLYRSDFDALFGHAEAIVDVPATMAPSEVITAYPEAKVILITRRDLDAWHRSIVKNFVPLQQSWMLWLFGLFNSELFWMREITHHYFIPGLFRSLWPATTTTSILHCGKWAYRDHCNMIRGMVQRERLLEWSVEDEWEPLCKFLNKDVPDEPFPSSNAGGAVFDSNINNLVQRGIVKALRRMALFATFNVAIVSYLVMLKRGKATPISFTKIRESLSKLFALIRI